MEKKIIKRLMALLACDSCAEPYEADNIIVLAHLDDLWFLKATCSSCEAETLVAAIIEDGILPEALTDLTKSDQAKFQDMDAITSDEVIDMYLFLQEFDGDFSQHFSRVQSE